MIFPPPDKRLLHHIFELMCFSWRRTSETCLFPFFSSVALRFINIHFDSKFISLNQLVKDMPWLQCLQWFWQLPLTVAIKCNVEIKIYIYGPKWILTGSLRRISAHLKIKKKKQKNHDDWWLHIFIDSSDCSFLMQHCMKFTRFNLPLAANDMKAWACFFILLTSVCLWMGNRTSKCSRKSNGVTDEMFHFNLFSTINSHCYRNKKKEERRKKGEFSHWNWIMGHLSGKQFTNKSNKHAFYWFLNNSIDWMLATLIGDGYGITATVHK